MSLLQLIICFGLLSEFDDDELMDLYVVVPIATRPAQLIHHLGLADKLQGTELIDRMIKKGRHRQAVKYIYSLKMVDKYPIIPLLKAHVATTSERAQELRRLDKSPRVVSLTGLTELVTLRGVRKFMKEHNLEDEYPLHAIEQQMIEITRQQEAFKRRVSSSTDWPPNVKKLNKQQNKQKQKQKALQQQKQKLKKKKKQNGNTMKEERPNKKQRNSIAAERLPDHDARVRSIA